MILTAVVTAIMVLLAVLISAGVIFYVVKKRFKRFTDEFFTAPDKDTPSPAALLTRQVANVFGTEISHSLKATFMGIQSVEAKNERGLEADILADTNPLLSVIMSSFPAVAKRIRKNPELAGVALSLVSKIKIANSNPAASTAGNDGSSNPYELK